MTGFQPRVENLEHRHCPATWIGDHGSPADDGLNWLENVVPVDGSDLYFPGPLAGPFLGRDAQGNPVLRYPGGDSDVLHGTFGNIFVGDGYAGRIMLDSDIVAQTLTLRSGTISVYDENTDSDNTLELVGGGISLDWTGGGFAGRPADFGEGGLNPPGDVGAVVVAGGTAVIAPENEGVVTLNTSLNFTNASTGVLRAGTIDVTNGGVSINVGGGSSLFADPGIGNVVQAAWPAGPGVSVNITGGADVTVLTGTIRVNGYGDNDGGVFTLNPGTSAEFSGNGADRWGYAQGPGDTRLYGGSALRVYGMKQILIDGGSFVTMAAAGGNSNATVETTLFKFSNGEISIGNGPSDSHAYGMLTIQGNVAWEGGTYRPCVEGDTDQGMSDVWRATGGFIVRQSAILAPSARDGENNPIPPETGYSWKVLEAVDGITTTGVAPQFETDDWALDKVGANNVIYSYEVRGL